MNDDLNLAPAEEILKGLQVRRTQDRLRITYRWRSGLGGIENTLGESFLFLMGLGFAAIPLASLPAMLNKEANLPLWQSLVALPFILLGAFTVYRGLGLACNRSVFEVSRQELKVRHGPLPFLGENFTLPAGEIFKVEWHKAGHTTHTSIHGTHGSTVSATFDVHVLTTGGQIKKLMSGLNDRQYAFAVQNELSRFLNPQIQ
jgi:hypothetical protein